MLAGRFVSIISLYASYRRIIGQQAYNLLEMFPFFTDVLFDALEPCVRPLASPELAITVCCCLRAARASHAATLLVYISHWHSMTTS